MVYGFCNKETDIKGINDIVTQNYFSKSACIRKYFNSTEQKYYNTNDTNFKWPKMAHGIFNPNNKFYNIILIKCQNEILNIVFGDTYKCKNIEEIIKFRGNIYFNFIDQYVNILNCESPIKKYFYRIENSIEKGSYSKNILNFNPLTIKTHNGFIFEKSIEEFGYIYDRHDIYTYLNKGDIHMIYSLLFYNRIDYYERTYKRIQDIL